MKVQKNNKTAVQDKSHAAAPRPIHTRASVNSVRCMIYGLICYLVVLFIVLQAIIPTRYDIKPRRYRLRNHHRSKGDQG